MMKPYKPLLLSFLCLLMGSWYIIDYHPYDVRINGETDVNAHNIAEIEQKCKDKTTIKFVTMGDSQRGVYIGLTVDAYIIRMIVYHVATAHKQAEE